jgi:phosphatidylglycerophosphate synthase
MRQAASAAAATVMLDRALLRLLQPLTTGVARRLHHAGVRADAITWVSFAFGMAACVAIVQRQYTVAIVLMLAGRAADGLDGAVARMGKPTDRGAFLDITLDFLFYAGVPLAFAWADAGANALAAATLLAAFIGTGSSFLALATLAARRGIDNPAMPNKGFYFAGGLTEGTETIACFVAMCVWPVNFSVLAYGFALLCLVTIATRIAAGLALLEDRP